MMEKVFAFINSAKGTFVYGILTKWYIAIAIPSMAITYIVFKQLDKLGIFDRILEEINKDLLMLEYVATTCTPKILKISELLQCIDF